MGDVTLPVIYNLRRILQLSVKSLISLVAEEGLEPPTRGLWFRFAKVILRSHPILYSHVSRESPAVEERIRAALRMADPAFSTLEIF